VNSCALAEVAADAAIDALGEGYERAHPEREQAWMQSKADWQRAFAEQVSEHADVHAVARVDIVEVSIVPFMVFGLSIRSNSDVGNEASAVCENFLVCMPKFPSALHCSMSACPDGAARSSLGLPRGTPPAAWRRADIADSAGRSMHAGPSSSVAIADLVMLWPVVTVRVGGNAWLASDVSKVTSSDVLKTLCRNDRLARCRCQGARVTVACCMSVVVRRGARGGGA
jgi:hypothetical protein